MKMIKRLGLLLSFLVTIFSAHATFAYVELTYTSDPIAWQWSRLYGVPDNDFGNYTLPSFTLSFRSDTPLALDSPTTFLLTDPSVTIDPLFFFNTYINPASNGKVIVNPDGTIAAWNFALKLSEANVINPAVHINIFSKGGPKTCNCEDMQVNIVISTEMHGHYLKLGLGEAHYRDVSSADNWSVKTILSKEIAQVPEPRAYAMMILALLLTGLMQIKRMRHQVI